MFLSQIIRSLEERLVLFAGKELIEFARALEKDYDRTVIVNIIDHIHYLLVVIRCWDNVVLLYAFFVDSEG